MKYRKKPVVIEAFKLNSRGLIGEEWFWDAVSENRIIIYNFGKNYPQDAWCEIKTLEGVMVAKTGDYIIRGVEGEIYPCKPDIFEKTYEVASQQPQLNDNQKIVLEWLKSNRNSLKVPMLAFYELAELADENTNLAYHQLDSKQEIEVLAAFAQWGLGQEEAE
ncbi:hypothetical protein [Enterococcus hirae]|uniref:hypothetical protein n=1 Tax=Enterococcus hirae TaxID=1354 RepID=UPI001F2A6D62|nr:hypothetical protein [Enterococcus hirae]